MTGAIRELSDRVLDGIMAESPDFSALLGRMPEEAPAGERLLPDFSEAGAGRRAAMVRGWAEELDALPPAVQAQDSVTAQVLSYVLNEGFITRFNGRLAEPLADQLEPLTHLNGVHTVADGLFGRDLRLATVSDAESYLARLAALPAAIDDAVETLQSRRGRGLTAATRLLDAALDEVAKATRGEAEAHTFYKRFAASQGVAASPHPAGLCAEVARLISGDVRAAYVRLAEEVTAQRAAAAPGEGACRRAGGEAFYRWRLRGHTTTTLTPAEVRDIGLQELERLDGELATVFAALGVSGTRIEAFAALAELDRFDQGVEGRTDAIETAQRAAADAQSGLRSMFRLWPRSGVEIKRVPLAEERSQFSSYIPPASGASDGVFWMNLAQATSTLRSETPILTFHETWPGHHVQIGIALDLPLPAFRRSVLFNAYMEGWAKYAEALPLVAGIVSDPMIAAAQLRMELYSTANLVLDTGLNAFDWTAERAAEFFREQTGASDALTDMVIMRALAHPGQLSSYKIGLLKVRELRERYARAKGAAFDIRDFHDAILGHGCLPLDVLERTVLGGVH